MRLSKKWIDTLFLRFLGIYKHKWKFESTECEEVAKSDWACALAKLTGEQIKKGLDFCNANIEWPPSPAEFKRYCLMDDDIPSQSDCYQALVRREFIHPIVRAMYAEIGSWCLSHDTENNVRREVAKLYNHFLKNPDALEKYKGDETKAYSLALKKLYTPSEHELVAELRDKLNAAGFGLDDPTKADREIKVPQQNISAQVYLQKGVDVQRLMKLIYPHLSYRKIGDQYLQLLQNARKMYPNVDEFTRLQGIEGELKRSLEKIKSLEKKD